MAEGRPITFLSDYGHRDEFAGVCRAVIAQIAPDAPLTDLTHGVPRGDVRAGALALAASLPYCAPGVHLAVVDPGVGTERRAVAVACGGSERRLLVGPDNGLLGAALRRFGGAGDAVDIGRSPFRLEPVSATFHGRDLFAPVAAHLSLGAALAEAGSPVDPETLADFELPVAQVGVDQVVAHVLSVDTYGNVALDLSPAPDGEGPLRPGDVMRISGPGGEGEARWVEAFGWVSEGEMLAYVDSGGALALAINGGSAAESLGLAPGDEVELRAA